MSETSTKWEKLSLRTLLRVGSVLLIPLSIVVVWAEAALQPYIESDFSYSADIVTADDRYDLENQRYTGERYSKGHFSYVLDTYGGSAIIQNTIDLNVIGAGKLTVMQKDLSVDTKTGSFLPADSAKHRQFLFAPRNLQKNQDFTFRHIAYNAPARMRFIGEETLYGLRTYHYETRFEDAGTLEAKTPETLPVTNDKTGILYQPHLQLWVEPTSGWLIKLQDNTTMQYFDRKTGAITAPFDRYTTRFTDESTKQQATYARTLRYRLVFTNKIAPAVLFLAGFSLLSLWLIRRLTKTAVAVRLGVSTAAFIAGVVLAGWIFGAHSFVTLFIGSSGINPLTVMCFILLVMSILMLHLRVSRFLALWLSGIAGAVALVCLLNALGVIGFSPDLLLYGDAVQSFDGTGAVRLSLYDGATLAVLALGLFKAAWSHKAASLRVAVFATGVVITLGVLGTIAVILQLDQVFSITPFYSLSAASAILFVVCGASLLVVLMSLQGIRTTWRGAVRLLWRPALVTLPIILIVAAAQFQQTILKQEIQTAFTRQTAGVQNTLNDTVSRYSTLLAGAQALFAASQQVDPDEWHDYIAAYKLDTQYPGAVSVGFAKAVQRAGIFDYESSVQPVTGDPFTVYPKTNNRTVTPVTYVEPLNGQNQKLRGYDPFSNDVLAEAMQSARDNDALRATRNIQLNTSDVNRPGFMLFLPVYQHKKPVGTIEERRAALQGYVFVTIDLRALLDGISTLDPGAADFTIYDGLQPESGGVLYSTQSDLNTASYTPRLTQTTILYLINRPWTIVYTARPEFKLGDLKEQSPRLILVIGTLIYVVSIGLVYTLVSYRNTLLRLSKLRFKK